MSQKKGWKDVRKFRDHRVELDFPFKMLRCLFFLVEKMYSVWSLSSEDLFAGNLANNDMGLKSR